MTFVILAAIVIGFWWWLYSPTVHLLRGFAGLIEKPEMRGGIVRVVFSKPSISGFFKNRSVALYVKQPRRRSQGYVVLFMETRAPDGAPWKDSSLTSRNPDVSRATFDLEGRYEMILTLEQGMLRAKWSALVWRFPGPFDEQKWRNVLRQMDVVAAWIETQAR